MRGLARTRSAGVAGASVLLALVGFGAATTVARPAATATGTLTGTVDESWNISLKNSDGTPVTTLAEGTYTVAVTDSTNDHNFHLFGPGVDRKTGVTAVESVTWTVTFTPGGYTYQCDPHDYSMKGSFTVTAAQTTTSSSTASTATTSTTSTTSTTTPTTSTAATTTASDPTSSTSTAEVTTTAPPPPTSSTTTTTAEHAHGPLVVEEVRVAVRRAGRARRVVVRLVVDRPVLARLRLLRKSRTIASKRARIPSGPSTLVLPVPRAAAPGRYVLELLLSDGASSRERLTRRIRLPR